MAPTITFVRHAQGYHNISTANHNMPDPQLTPYGREQCAHLSKSFPNPESIDLLVASPIKRTIYTALLSFPGAIESNKLTIIGLPEVQETSDLPCDTGSEKAEIEREFAGYSLDLSLVTPGWNSKTGRWAPTTEALKARARDARKWLQARPEKHIVVVTHGGILHYLTEDWVDYDKFSGTGWANTEFRSYQFKDASPTENASLVETAESRARRIGTEKPLTEAEKRNLAVVDANDKDHADAKPRSSKVKSWPSRPPKIALGQRDWVGGYGI